MLTPAPLPPIPTVADLTEFVLSVREATEDAARWQLLPMLDILDELGDLLADHWQAEQDREDDLADPIRDDDDGYRYSDDDSYNDLADLDDAYTPGSFDCDGDL